MGALSLRQLGLLARLRLDVVSRQFWLLESGAGELVRSGKPGRVVTGESTHRRRLKISNFAAHYDCQRLKVDQQVRFRANRIRRTLRRAVPCAARRTAGKRQSTSFRRWRFFGRESQRARAKFKGIRADGSQHDSSAEIAACHARKYFSDEDEFAIAVRARSAGLPARKCHAHACRASSPARSNVFSTAISSGGHEHRHGRATRLWRAE